MAPQALIYTRVSQDRAGGRSPAEQEQEARVLCGREGWEVAEVVTDSVGASRHSKGRRTGWEQVQKRLADGNVEVLVTWEASRAQRDLNAYAQLRELCATHGVLWSYSGRTFDMAESGDRFTTGLDALLAEREADETADRVRRAMRSNAAQGRPHGRRLFGYQRIYAEDTGLLLAQVENPDEAPVVRRIFDTYLSGSGVRTVARRLNNDGVTTSTGARWNDAQIRRVLVNPSYVAKRVHKGEVVGDGDWPALVDLDVFDRTQARLVAQRTSTTRQTSTARLLTGVGRCGVCGGKVNAGHDRNKRKMYQCREKFCIARDLVMLDDFVTQVVLARLSQPDVTEALAGAPDPAVEAARSEVDKLRGRLDDAISEFTAGNLTAVMLAKIEARLQPLIDDADRAVRRAVVPIALDVPTDDLAVWWESIGPEVRREVVATIIAAVVILPSNNPGSHTFDPDTVRIEWRR